MADTASPAHYCEGAVQLLLGPGFFRPQSRPSRDAGVLLTRWLTRERPGRVLDLMAGCGIRALRYGLEGRAQEVWANDADGDRLPLLKQNLQPLQKRRLELSARTAQHLLADCLMQQRRFDLLDLDAFGCPTALVPLALEALEFGGVLYLASTDGRSPTGHDRPAAIRSLGAAARAHPSSWELALRLQLAVVAKAAWAMGRGIRPLFSFSEGRTFRTAIQLRRRPEPRKRSSSACGPTAIAAPSSPNKACCACAAGRPAVAATTRRPPYRFQAPFGWGPFKPPRSWGSCCRRRRDCPRRVWRQPVGACWRNCG